MSGWLLAEISVEGFRGINNEGAPLVLKLKTDKVNSISAANGVAKSSVFDALTYALTRGIPKLDELKQAEAGGSFYLNKFHPGKKCTIKLNLEPVTGGNRRIIEITRDNHGNRTATTSDGSDAEAALAELNREFVLLDADTFQSFMTRAPLDRGRSFAGLLGLSSYSALRRGLQALSDTRRFNNTMQDAARRQAKAAAETRVNRLRQLAGTEYQALVKEALSADNSQKEAEIAAHKALEQIALLKEHCTGKTFYEIDTEACAERVRTAEAGTDRKRLEKVVELEGEWTISIGKQPTEAAGEELVQLCRARDKALDSTKGDLLKELYELTERVANHESWADKLLCPSCEQPGEAVVADNMKEKLAVYAAVETATDELKLAWAAGGWNEVEALEKKVLTDGETSSFTVATADLLKSGLSADNAAALVARLGVVKKRADSKLTALKDEHQKLAATLPPSLVALTEAVSAAKRLQENWQELKEEEAKLAQEKTWAERTTRLKSFLDAACMLFSAAESEASARRLAAVEPLCRDMFGAVMNQPVVPSLTKRQGTDELGLALTQFFSLQNEPVPARAVLSESYRNAFAASVYLAAAKLYGGTPRFIVLDDITSSFDAGHQFHLLEVIRTKFSRPVIPDGPQVILFSHDTLLEKLFNTNVQTGGWWHQRLQGTPETAVLPQNNAVDKVGEKTRALLNAGQVDSAAPFIRQYLEFRLDEIVQRCRVPVPIDIAISDTKRLPGEYLNAIEAAVALNEKAGTLILEPNQRSSMTAHVASITGNYLAHWATGSTINFSAGSLLGVMKAIDDYSDCFKYVDPANGQKKFYRSLSQK